jgi:hypothetical protein
VLRNLATTPPATPALSSPSVANDDGAVLLEPDDDGPGIPPPTGQDVAAKYSHKPSHVVALAMSDQQAAVGPSQEGVSHLTTCS